MRLYDRDFMGPASQEEKNALEAEYAFKQKPGIKRSGDAPRFSHPKTEIRDFLWHATSLFPNNHLNPIAVKYMNLEAEATTFSLALDAAQNEQSIQAYIKENRKWFIPASLYKDYNFGHHGGYLFPEQRLGAEYQADYMLLGKNSEGYSIVLIEFEDVHVDFMLSSSNMETNNVRKGMTQIRDWKRWLDSHRQYFIESCGLKEHEIDIPTSRIHYVLVVGRRSRMNKTARDLRSQISFETPNLKIVTYDRLVDNIFLLSNGY